MIRMALSSIGIVPEELLLEIREALEATFPVVVATARTLPLIPAAYDAARRQWNSPLLLESAMAATPGNVVHHLAVTSEDLFIPMLTFVYGQAQLGGRAALVSIARLRQDFYRMPDNAALLKVRARKEAIHETGHMFGLIHCASEACAMRLSTNIRQLDLKPDALCAQCSAHVWERPL